MKYLLTVIMMIGLLWPTASLAEEPHDNYKLKKGDYVTAAIICPKEEDILKVVKADTVSEEETLARMYALSMIGKCVRLPIPLPFHVIGVYVVYKDHKGKDSVVLSVSRPDMKDKLFGYLIAQGKQGKDTGI